MKPAKKKVVEEEKKAPNLPYTQILKMVQVIDYFFALCSDYLQVAIFWGGVEASSSENSEIDS